MNVTEIDKSVKDLFAKSKLGRLKNTYLGVFLLNSFKNLPLTNYKFCSLIIFIDNLSKNLGHWVCLFKIHNNLYFIDSFGKKPLFYKKTITNRYLKCNYYMKKRFQGNNSTVCGAYVIFFIYNIIKFKYDINNFQSHIRTNLHPTKYTLNDRIIVNFIMDNTSYSLTQCEHLFCSKKFIVNIALCKKTLCSKKKKKKLTSGNIFFCEGI